MLILTKTFRWPFDCWAYDLCLQKHYDIAGYRHVNLRNESNQPLLLPSLFVQFSVKDYVSDMHAGIDKDDACSVI